MKRVLVGISIIALSIGVFSCVEATNKPKIKAIAGSKVVVYHSYWGNTQVVAEAIAQAVGADLVELQTQEPLRIENWKPMLGNTEISFSSTPPLRPLRYDPKNYDVVFIGTPVWMWQHTPVVNSYLASSGLQGKRIALFCTYANRTGDTLGMMRSRLGGNQIIGEKAFRRPNENRGQAQSDAAAWARSMVGE